MNPALAKAAALTVAVCGASAVAVIALGAEIAGAAQIVQTVVQTGRNDDHGVVPQFGDDPGSQQQAMRSQRNGSGFSQVQPPLGGPQGGMQSRSHGS